MKPLSVDALVVGAGPAGCSAASWLAQTGLRVMLADRAAQPCAGLAAYTFAQDWLLGQPGRCLAEVGAEQAAHIRALAGRLPLQLRLGVAVGRPAEGLHAPGAGALQPFAFSAERGWLVPVGEALVQARWLVVATGLVARRPEAWFGTGHARVVDAIGLTHARDAMPPGSRILLLGGGDNAAENAAHLSDQGHAVTVALRHWRGQPALLARVQGDARIEQLIGPSLPRPLAPGGSTAAGAAEPALRPDPEAAIPVRMADGALRLFDWVAVLFGFEPVDAVHAAARAALDAAHHPGVGVAPAAGALAEVPSAGLFVAGDASGRWHPCVQTALADGVRVAKAIQHLAGGREIAPPPVALDAAALAPPARVLRLEGLEVQARIGWLDHEHEAPQRVRVDAELALAPLPVHDDDLAHVLDYRRVRAEVIEACTREHTRLLETLVDRLARRLLRLPTVLGVRLRIAKLDIFEDCHVDIATQLGRW